MASRRQFLLAASAVLAAALPLRFALGSDAAAIAVVVRKRLGYLKLDDAGVETFARELAALRTIATGKLRLAAATGLLYVDLGDSNPLGRSLRHGEERIVNYYLLSSDFFINGADESRTVAYLGFFNPLNHVCRNPFARFEPDAMN